MSDGGAGAGGWGGIGARGAAAHRWMVIERGTWPVGTSLASSWIFTSWNLMNFEPRVCSARRPFLLQHAGTGHVKSGMNDRPFTSWYTS